MAYGARQTAAEAGTTSLKGYRRRLPFRSVSTRAIRILSGRSPPLNGDRRDVFPPTRLQRFGGHAMAAKAGRRCVKACRRRVASSLFSAKRWPVTNVIQRESILHEQRLGFRELR